MRATAQTAPVCETAEPAARTEQPEIPRAFSPREVARALSLTPRQVTRIFADEPGVLKFPAPAIMKRKKNRRELLRIPHAVIERVLRKAEAQAKHPTVDEITRRLRRAGYRGD